MGEGSQQRFRATRNRSHPTHPAHQHVYQLDQVEGTSSTQRCSWCHGGVRGWSRGYACMLVWPMPTCLLFADFRLVLGYAPSVIIATLTSLACFFRDPQLLAHNCQASQDVGRGLWACCCFGKPKRCVLTETASCFDRSRTNRPLQIPSHMRDSSEKWPYQLRKEMDCS